MSDPFFFILFAAILGGCIGFFAASIFAARTVRDLRSDSFRDGYACCNRDHHNRTK